MTARIYPSICRFFFFLAILDVAIWIYPPFSLPAALISALLQETFWLLLWKRADRRLLFVGFILTEGLALFLLRGTDIIFSLLFAGIAFPCTFLLYPRTVPEVTSENTEPSRPEKKDLLRLLPLAVLLVLLIYRFQSGDVEKLSVLPLLFLLLIEGARIAYGRFAIRLAGLTAILMLILALLPIPKKPIDWSFAERFVAAVQEQMETIRMDLSYYTSGFGGGEGTTGYSGLGRVTDSVGTEKHTELLLTERNVSGQFHLTGAVFSKYEGDHWTGKQEKEDLSWMTEFLDALHRADVTKEEAACFSELRGERITYAYLRTKDRMLPLSTTDVKDIVHRRSDMFEKGDAYELRYLDVDFGNPMLQELIRNAGASPQSEAPPTELSDYAKELYGTTVSPEEASPEDLSPFLDQSGITERMRTLSDEITAGADNPYDAALMIEQYLRQFEYKRLTDVGGDLDRFLLESREGYCVHFASAMVLLSRAQGIPARYCEGYLTRFAEKDANGNYVVSSVDGHAWAEVYINGFGWVPMEPTPVIASSAIESGWGRTVSTEEEKERQPFIPPIPTPDTEAAGEEIIPEETQDNGYLRVLLIVVGFLASFLLLTFGIRFLVTRIAYHRLSPREKAVAEFRALRKKYLAVSRCEDRNQSMRETLQGVAKMVEGADAETLLSFWYEVRYGDRTEVAPAALKDLAQIRRKLRRAPRKAV